MQWIPGKPHAFDSWSVHPAKWDWSRVLWTLIGWCLALNVVEDTVFTCWDEFHNVGACWSSLTLMSTVHLPMSHLASSDDVNPPAVPGSSLVRLYWKWNDLKVIWPLHSPEKIIWFLFIYDLCWTFKSIMSSSSWLFDCSVQVDMTMKMLKYSWK